MDTTNKIPEIQETVDSREFALSKLVPPPLPPQTEHSNRYLLLENLGEGGMGIVQRVQDVLLDREVALKKIKNFPHSNTTLSKKQKLLLWRLKREASLMAILEHPNIVPLYDMQENNNGELYFTMRKVQGETFRSILRKKREGTQEISEVQRLSIFLKICDAVAYAHAKKIVHRDLKPENIMLGPFGEVYVMDWGIAKQLASDPSASSPILDETSPAFPEDTLEEEAQTPLEVTEDFHTIGGIGTEGYMAPEQKLNASQVTASADIYALGKMLRECFRLLSPVEEFLLEHSPQILLAKFPSTTLVSRKIPSEINAIVNKATQKEPSARYPDVKALASDLERYMQQRPVSVKQYHLLEILVKWTRRNRKSLLLISISILLCSLLFFYSQDRTRRHLLMQHQTRLDHWLKVMRDPVDGIQRDLALLEINKMREPEILHLLLERMQEGTRYFIEQPSRNPKEEEFYLFIVAALGWLEQPSAGVFLMDALRQMSQKIATHPQKTASVSENLYLTALARSLGYCKAEGYATEFQKFRWEIGQNHPFWKATHVIYQELALRDRLDLQKFATAKDYQERGLRKYLTKDYAGAIADYTQALTFEPDNPDIYNARGIAKNVFSDYTGAIADYSKALALSPQLVKCYQNRGYSKTLLNDFSGALEDFNQGLLLSPQNDELYIARGLLWNAQQKWDQAIHDFTKAIQLNPKSVEAHINRGLARDHKKEFTEAIHDYTQALVLNDQEWIAYINRGTIYLEQKQYEFALQDSIRASTIDPQNPIAYYNLGQAKYGKKDILGAIDSASEAIRLDPKMESAYYFRGVLYFQQNQETSALNDFTKALRLDPQRAESYYYRGICYYRQTLFDLALTDFQEAIRLNPQLKNAYRNRANVYYVKQQFDLALADYAIFLQENPNEVEVHYFIGLIYSQQRKWNEALSAFTEVLRLEPKHLEALNRRGFAYLKTQQYLQAIYDYTEITRLNPDKLETYSNLMDCNLKLKDRDSAQKWAQQLLEKTQNNLSENALKLRERVFQKFPELRK